MTLGEIEHLSESFERLDALVRLKAGIGGRMFSPLSRDPRCLRALYLSRARNAMARARLYRAAAKWYTTFPVDELRAAELNARAYDKAIAALLWRDLAHRMGRELRRRG